MKKRNEWVIGIVCALLLNLALGGALVWYSMLYVEYDIIGENEQCALVINNMEDMKTDSGFVNLEIPEQENNEDMLDTYKSCKKSLSMPIDLRRLRFLAGHIFMAFFLLVFINVPIWCITFSVKSCLEDRKCFE